MDGLGWWFEILRIPLSNNPFHKGIPGIQTTNPNHQPKPPNQSLVDSNLARRWGRLESNSLPFGFSPVGDINGFGRGPRWKSSWGRPEIQTCRHWDVKPVGDGGCCLLNSLGGEHFALVSWWISQVFISKDGKLEHLKRFFCVWLYGYLCVQGNMTFCSHRCNVKWQLFVSTTIPTAASSAICTGFIGAT